MASMSPEQYSTQSPPDGSNGNGLSLEVLKNLAEKRTTREGNPPKKRGPKPDSKPALTRRQELNRQAQRTHRERKEMYIRALEDEVLRLKEIYSTVAQDREKLAEENRLLKDALVQSGIQLPNLSNGRGSGGEDGASNFGAGGAPNPSFGFGNNYNSSFSPGGASQSSAPTASPDNSARYNALSRDLLKKVAKNSSENSFDVEQAGIDFVLALEKPCMAHLPLVMDMCTENKGIARGHALMASCPSAQTKTLDKSLWGQSHTHETPTEGAPAQGTWEINKADLSTLLALSGSLNLDGEVTPVMAWNTIMNHPDFSKLTREDFNRLTSILGSKVRCFGFGAVMEEFELQDAIAGVHGSRIEQAAY